MRQSVSANEIAQLLTWKEGSAAPEFLRSRYGSVVEQRLRSHCLDQGGDLKCIAASLALLPSKQRHRFLRSPLVASRVLSAGQASALDYAPIASALLAELAVAGIVRGLTENVWTALGDRKLEPARVPWNGEPATIAGTQVVIDSAGPMDLSCPATGRLILPDRRERDAAVQKIDAAAAAIAESSVHALRFWNACHDVLAIRKAANASAKCSSNSFTRNARLALIVNAHLPGIRPASIADAIIHEAIHSLLFMYEETHAPLVSRDDEALSIVVASPWTGKELFLSAYVHACVIWYGLFWFWHAVRLRRSLSTKYCDYFRRRAAKGFARGPLTGLPAKARNFLSDEATGLLRDIESHRLTGVRRGR